MKVKDRLALQFTLLFAVLLFVALSGIYIFIQHYRTASFFKQLDDRAKTVAEFYLAEDNLSTHKFKDVLKKFPQSLSHEHFRIYNDQLQPEFIPEDSVRWSKAFLKKVLTDRLVHLTKDKEQVTGLYYSDNSGNFLFIISAIDLSGYRTMRELRVIMLMVFIVLLIITFFIGRIFATISLSPIVKIRDNLRSIKATDLHMRLDVKPLHADQ